MHENESCDDHHHHHHRSDTIEDRKINESMKQKKKGMPCGCVILLAAGEKMMNTISVLPDYFDTILLYFNRQKGLTKDTQVKMYTACNF